MSPKKYDSADEFLKDPSGDVAKLRGMGITDFAIITYLVRVNEGQSKESALRGLLQGRSLSGEQQLFVRLVLERFRLPKFSSEGGHMLLDPAIVRVLDRVCVDSEKIFFSGLLLILALLLM